MEPNSDYKRGFKIKHDKIDGRFHIGIFFCVDYKDVFGKRDKYLFICLGFHEFSVGIITYREEQA